MYRWNQQEADPVSDRLKYLLTFLLVALFLSTAGCGSTKVYTADKTIVYNGNTYNMASVQRIGSRMDGHLPDDETVNMRSLDKKGIEAMFKEHDEIMVSSIVEMDSNDMVYQRKRIGRYSDYSKMDKRLEGAMKDINKFMADEKKTQLQLK